MGIITIHQSFNKQGVQIEYSDELDVSLHSTCIYNMIPGNVKVSNDQEMVHSEHCGNTVVRKNFEFWQQPIYIVFQECFILNQLRPNK